MSKISWKFGWINSTTFTPFINSIADTPTIDLAISGWGVLTANSRWQNTNMIMTADHVSWSTFSLAWWPWYTVSWWVATIGADNTAFLNTAEIQFYISWLLLKKGSDVTWVSSTSFIVNYPLSNWWDIQILWLA